MVGGSTSQEDLAKPIFRFHPNQRHPNFRRPTVQASFEECEDRSLVSSRVKEELRTSKKQSLVARVVI